MSVSEKGYSVKNLLSENISGKPLCLSIINHESSNLCFEFTVKHISDAFSKIKLCVLASFVVILGLSLYAVGEDFGLGLGLLLGKGQFLYAGLYSQSVFILTLWYCISTFLLEIKSESLLVVAPLGLQLTSTFRSGYQTSNFIPWYSVADIIINEAITLHRVIYYLAVIVEEVENGVTQKRLIPLYKHTRPRLAALQPIYQTIQNLHLLRSRTEF